MESIREVIVDWVAPIFGWGDGQSSGWGSSWNDGWGSGDDYGPSYGSGYGSGDSQGYGCGDGSGHGSGSDYGSGDGSGDGRDYGIKTFCGQAAYNVDGVRTLIYVIFGNYAKGAILNGDLTTTPCYIAKRNGVFAHGETIRKAEQALTEKLYDLEPLDERIDKFVEAHAWDVEYPVEDFYNWHHILTGSCEMGRKAFAKDHGIDIEHDVMTVEQFLTLTENDYGGEIIKDVKERYKKED